MKDPHSVGWASLILVLGFAGSRALGVIRNMALAETFGAGAELDAYFAAFRLPDIIFQLIAGAALGSAFLPTFATVFTRVSPAAAWRLSSAAITFFTLLGAATAAVGFLLAPLLVPLTVPGFQEAPQALTVTLTRVMLASAVFFCASGIITGTLNARYHFLLPAIAPALYNLSIIGGTLTLSGSWGILAPAWGVVIGAALHLLVQLPGLVRIGMVYHWRTHPATAGLGEVLRLMGPRVLSLASIQVNWLVITVLASTLSVGNLAALSYAWAVAMLPLGVFGIAPATAAFPALAEAAAQGNWKRYQEMLSTGVRLTLFLAIPGSVGLILLREPLVVLLFQRGLFDAESARLTATALLFFSVGLAAHTLLEVASRGSYALRDTRTPLLFALIGSAGHIVFSLLLVRPLGAGGLALAMSLAAVLEAGGLFLALTRRVQDFDWSTVATSATKTLIATAVMGGAVLWMLRALSPGQEAQEPLLAVLAGGLLGLGVFTAAAALLKSPDLSAMWQQLRVRR